MVAAICILGIFIYFFFWSRKLKKEQFAEWRTLSLIEEREEITAVVMYSFLQKKRFSPQYWYWELEASIYIPQEKETLKLKWVKADTPDLQTPNLVKKQKVWATGYRRQGVFYANRITAID